MKTQTIILSLILVLLPHFIISFRNTELKFSLPNALAQTTDSQLQEADQLLQQGIENYQKNQLKKAIEFWEKDLILYRNLQDQDGESATLSYLGVSYLSLGNIEQAIETLQAFLTLSRKAGNRQNEAQALGNLGLAYQAQGNYEKAIEFHQENLNLAREIRNRYTEAVALGNLGNSYQALANYQQALKFYTESLVIAREVRDRQLEGAALRDIGLSYYELGNFKQALDYQQQYLIVAQQTRNPQAQSSALGNIGVIYQSLGDYQKAIEFHQQHLELAEAISDEISKANALGNLGNIYKFLGNYSQAIAYQEQALQIMQQEKSRQGAGKVLSNLGNVYEALGEYEKALDSHQQSLAIFKEIQDSRSEAITLGSLGRVYANLGEFEQAIQYYQASLTIAETIQDKEGQAGILNNMGAAYHSLRKHQKAIESYQKSLAIAQEIDSQPLQGVAFGSLGLAYENLGNFDQAIEFHQKSLAIAQEIADPRAQALALNNLGHTLFQSNQFQQAEQVLYQAIEIRESLRIELEDQKNVSLFDTQVLTYNLLQQVLIQQNKIESALEISDRGRTRAFVDLLARRLSQEAADTFQKTSPSLTLEQIKKIAQSKNATLVQYSIIPDEEFLVQGKLRGRPAKLYIWVVQPAGKIDFREVDLSELKTSFKDLISLTRDFIGVRGRGLGAVSRQEGTTTTINQLQTLHKFLIEPIADLLPASPENHVIFIPQDDLFLVPFAALQDSSEQYLIQKHTILTAPSIQVLDFTRQPRKPGTQTEILIVGNPIMPKIADSVGEAPQPLPPLPGAEKEALAIAQIFNTPALTGTDATETFIKTQLKNAKLIHLATHGLLDDLGTGIPGILALTPSAEDDGLLTASEILNLSLNADLVVLSACDTGRGVITGDGVYGLSRSLISAGSQSIVVSLWSVPDDSTAFLMSEFYRQLQQNPDKAQALRQAMLTTLQQKQYAAPVSWAAFTLIGETDSSFSFNSK
jgi:CHAT domain-containing protein/Flp pilus assembly protein TadD